MIATIAVIAISRKGSTLASRLSASLGDDTTLILDRRFHEASENASVFDLPVRPVIEQAFDEYQHLVLFMPVGAAVRLLASRLKDKHHDPAVVCVDDAGRFAVSLLSGHAGGADDLTRRVASILGSEAVITSASHVTGSLALDLLGQEFGWRLDAPSIMVTRASAKVINGEPTGIFQAAGETQWWPPNLHRLDNIQVFQSLEALAQSSCTAALAITDETNPDGLPALKSSGKDLIVYRPRTLVVGMGCRKGVPVEELDRLLVDTFQRHGLALESIACVATAEIKRDERGIQQLADKYGIAVICYGVDELNRVFGEDHGGLPDPSSSQRWQTATVLTADPTSAPRRLVGAWGVSEPAALLASDAKGLLVSKEKSSRATVAVARKVYE